MAFHVNGMGEYYVFEQLSPSNMFGSDVILVFPAHGDFNCPCNKCRSYRGVNAIETECKAYLRDVPKELPKCKHSMQAQAIFDKNAGIVRIHL